MMEISNNEAERSRGSVKSMSKFRKMMAALLVLALCLSTFAMTAALAQSVKIKQSCNLRSGPGLGYRVKRTIAAGKTATYQGSRKKDSRGVSWLKVKYNGTTGWVSTRMASLSSSSSSKSYSGSGRKVKATGSVHIRTSPSRSGRIIGAISYGTRLKYRGKSSKDGRGVRWYAVYYNGRKGWVSSRYSKLV